MSAAGAEADAMAAAAVACAEAAGLRLRLEGGGRVRWRCRGEPPAGPLAELRRHRDAVARLLAERQAGREAGGVAIAPNAPDAPYASAPGSAMAATGDGTSGAEHVASGMAGAPMAGADPPGAAASRFVAAARAKPTAARLGGVAAAIRAALADGAEREADPEGWLVLVRPDGRRSVVPPGTVAQLAEAGLLPALPEARETVEAARCARPPSWSETEDAPEPGDRCVCGGRRWWCDAEAPRGWWCWGCHPPDPLPAGRVREVRT